MKLFVAITAIMAWVFGLALLFLPSQFYAPTGITMTPLIATIAQAHGATLVWLGCINWLALSADRRVLKAIMGGNLVVQVLSLFVVVRTMTLGPGMAVAPAIVIHVVLGACFAYFYLKLRRETVA